MAINDGWYPDPMDGNRLRFWSQGAWTAHTRDRAVTQETAAAPGTVGAGAPAAPPTFATPPGVYGPSQQAKPGRSTGIIIGVVVGVVVVVMVVSGVATFLAQRNKDNEAEAIGTATPSPTSAEPALDIDAVERPLTRPADYAVPAGFVEHTDETLGVTFGIPEEWVDITEDYAQYYDLGAEDDSAGEIVEYVGAWTSSGTAEYGPDDVVITHSRLLQDTPPSLYNRALLRSISIGADGVEWGDPDPYVTDLGLPVIKTVGVPVDQTYFVEDHVWIVGGGDTMVVVTCAVYGVGHQCDAVDDIVNGMWVEP